MNIRGHKAPDTRPVKVEILIRYFTQATAENKWTRKAMCKAIVTMNNGDTIMRHMPVSTFFRMRLNIQERETNNSSVYDFNSETVFVPQVRKRYSNV
jgi:hypothetical protein